MPSQTCIRLQLCHYPLSQTKETTLSLSFERIERVGIIQANNFLVMQSSIRKLSLQFSKCEWKSEMIMRKLYIKRKDNEKVVDSRVKNKPFPSSKPAIVTRRVVDRQILILLYLVEKTGLEPATYRLRTCRSTR